MAHDPIDDLLRAAQAAVVKLDYEYGDPPRSPRPHYDRWHEAEMLDQAIVEVAEGLAAQYARTQSILESLALGGGLRYAKEKDVGWRGGKGGC